MSSTSRSALNRAFDDSDTSNSLAWDDNGQLLQLLPSPPRPLDVTGLSDILNSQDSGDDDVFNNDVSFATSSPYSERRVTRSMLSTASTLSPRLDRYHFSRRRLRVRFADQNTSAITDIPNQTSGQPRTAPAQLYSNHQ